MSGVRPAAQLPEPGRLWIRFVPRSWPLAEGLRLDLARAGLAPGGARAAGPAEVGELPAVAGPLDDLLYLPAVAPAAAADRDRLARGHLAAGTPVLVQLAAGEEAPAAEGGGLEATPVYDLLEPLIERDLGRLGDLPAGAAAVWPLVPGLTDDPEVWAEGCAQLATAGPRPVQALGLQLDPVDRRRLAERGGEAAFDALFHRAERQAAEPAVERAFARVAHAHGLAPFLPRPLPGPQVQGRENRHLGGLLALAAELWLRLGRPAGQGQALYGAARQADRTHYDLRALAREGNLAVLGWLDPLGRAAAGQWAGGGRIALLDELLAEYLAPIPAGSGP